MTGLPRLARISEAVIVSALLAATATADVSTPRASGGKGGELGVFSGVSMKVGRHTRSFRLVAPKSLDPEKQVPMLFAFHGVGDTGERMAAYTGLDALAEEKGFVLVYPESRGTFWPLDPRLAEDDLDFFDALCGRLTAEYNIDLSRVYLTGMSNGAYFISLLATKRSERISAIAVHSGGWGLSECVDMARVRKYAVMIVHGDADTIVPVEENRRARDLYRKWGFEVELEEVPGLGHEWASKVDINHRIWGFFEKHPTK